MKNISKQAIVSTVVLLVGIIILMNSVSFGDEAVQNRLIREGGISNILMYTEQYISNYRVLGGILTFLGGFGIVVNTRSKPE